MATTPEMDALVAAVAAEDTVIASAVTTLNGLAGMIAAAAGDRTASIALANDVQAQATALSTAIATVNPPPAPPVAGAQSRFR